MLVLSVTWMFMPHWNLIHGYCNLNRFSNTFPASLFQSSSCSFAFFPWCCHLRQFRLEIFWNFTWFYRPLNISLECEMWEETTEGKNITEIRHLKKIIHIWNRHIFKEERKGALIMWVGREKSIWCWIRRSVVLKCDGQRSLSLQNCTLIVWRGRERRGLLGWGQGTIFL